MSNVQIPMPSRSLGVSADALNRRTPAQPEAVERYRPREFGTGYGRSSGYAASQRYLSDNRSRPFAVR